MGSVADVDTRPDSGIGQVSGSDGNEPSMPWPASGAAADRQDRCRSGRRTSLDPRRRSARGAWASPRAMLAGLCASALLPIATAEPGLVAVVAGANVAGSHSGPTCWPRGPANADAPREILPWRVQEPRPAQRGERRRAQAAVSVKEVAFAEPGASGAERIDRILAAPARQARGRLVREAALARMPMRLHHHGDGSSGVEGRAAMGATWKHLWCSLESVPMGCRLSSGTGTGRLRG